MLFICCCGKIPCVCPPRNIATWVWTPQIQEIHSGFVFCTETVGLYIHQIPMHKKIMECFYNNKTFIVKPRRGWVHSAPLKWCGFTAGFIHLILRIHILMMTCGYPSIPDSPAEMDRGTLRDMQIAWKTAPAMHSLLQERVLDWRQAGWSLSLISCGFYIFFPGHKSLFWKHFYSLPYMAVCSRK